MTQMIAQNGQEGLASPSLIRNTSFEIRLRWIDKVDGRALNTFAAFSVHLNGSLFWPTLADSPEGLPVEWYADHILSYLVRNWRRLSGERGYPVDITPAVPSEIWNAASERWENMASDRVLLEEDQLMAFDKAHNLANAFGGLFGLDCFWVVRAGDGFIIDNGVEAALIDEAAVLGTLGLVGDIIAERLAKIGAGKWAPLIQRWHECQGAEIPALAG